MFSGVKNDLKLYTCSLKNYLLIGRNTQWEQNIIWVFLLYMLCRVSMHCRAK